MFKLLIVDVDGVMTDSTKLYDGDMKITHKQFSDLDTTAIKRFIKDGVKIAILTADAFNKSLEDRRKISVYYAEKQQDGTRDKVALLYQILDDFGVKPHEVAYVGDDLLDIPIMQSVGRSFAPENAIDEVKQQATVVLPSRGGTGVLKDIYEIYNRKRTHEEDQININALRYTCSYLLYNAGSGHPGMALGAAPIMYSLFKYHLNHVPDDTLWLNRDRLVLSAGHGSILLYTMLHLAGYPITWDDLMEFRHYGGNLSGHPERNRKFGIDVTTGALGQGFANAVGLAIAGKHMNAKHKTDSLEPFDHKVYTVVGDGCMMEGITQEAASLAGSLGLSNLIAIYDQNLTTIDGGTAGVMNDNVGFKFGAMGWKVLYAGNVDEDITKLNDCINEAKENQDTPTLIIARTTIGYGLSDAGHSSAHCRVLGTQEVEKLEDKMVDKITNLRKIFTEVDQESTLKCKKWYADTKDMRFGSMTEEICYDGVHDGPWTSTRDLHGRALPALAKDHPLFLGGSGDLSHTTRSLFTEGNIFNVDKKGNHICFGAREHAMAGACNGIAAWASFATAYCSTFTVFSDYMMPSIRLAAMSKLKVMYFFTHDSVCGAADGPTHQSIEQLNNLRNIPGLIVMRPANADELIGCYQIALRHEGPSAFILSTHKTNLQIPKLCHYHGFAITYFNSDNPRAILVSSGHDLENTMGAADILLKKGITTRVLSIPSVDRFIKYEKPNIDNAFENYKVPIITIESCSHTMLPIDGVHHIGIDKYGVHGTARDLFKFHGLDAKGIARKVMEIIRPCE